MAWFRAWLFHVKGTGNIFHLTSWLYDLEGLLLGFGSFPLQFAIVLPILWSSWQSLFRVHQGDFWFRGARFRFALHATTSGCPHGHMPPKKPVWHEVLWRLYWSVCSRLITYNKISRNISNYLQLMTVYCTDCILSFSARKLSWCIQFAS